MFAVKQPTVLAASLTNNAHQPGSEPEIGQVCANISPRERRKRLNFGIMMSAVSLIALVVLLATGANHWWRLGLFLLFASAATGFFQWHDKTCVAYARINSRKIGDQIEKIENPAELAQVRRQARNIQIKATLVGILLTLLVLLLP